ncbi:MULTISPECIES: phytanoyl-CoA dioxygenase family protein [unclassified Micromonospora]|uniref:phytanoyl-CoA dioxygenase family protein n=1 Tax=unclassified Micromonospora TaxID=2617518 RepID=UPI00362E5B64
MLIPPSQMQTMSTRELYLFDTMGLLRIPGFLSPDAVEVCRDEVRRLSSTAALGDGEKEKVEDLVGRSAHFAELAADEAVRALVAPLTNQPYRLIESYALRRTRQSVFYLHNGGGEVLRYGGDRVARRNMSYMHTFHDGKLYCMFVKVLIYLSDVLRDDDGPFCYLQGSHKANFAWFPDGDSGSPNAWVSETGNPRAALTRENFPSLEFVRAKAGDALVINEALLHGSLQKASGGERILTALGFAPSFVTDWKRLDPRSNDIQRLGHY